MHRYNLRPRRRNNDPRSNRAITGRRQGPKALVSFKKPSKGSEPVAGHAQYLKSIFATNPQNVNGRWCIAAAWYGLDGVYDEPISMLIAAGGYSVMYHLNDIHGRNAAFSEYWKGLCSPPSHQINVGLIILKKKETKYVHVIDRINPEKNYIYPGYNSSTLASGKELRMAAANTSYVCDEIIYIQNDDDIIIFENFIEAKSDYIRRAAKDIFHDLLSRGILKKIRIGRGPRHSSNIETINEFVWNNYLRGLFYV